MMVAISESILEAVIQYRSLKQREVMLRRQMYEVQAEAEAVIKDIRCESGGRIDIEPLPYFRMPDAQYSVLYHAGVKTVLDLLWIVHAGVIPQGLTQEDIDRAVEECKAQRCWVTDSP